MTKIKAFADRYLEKFMSRTLLVWLTSCYLLFADKLNGEQWLEVSIAYIGLTKLADIVSTIKKAGSKTNGE